MVNYEQVQDQQVQDQQVQDQPAQSVQPEQELTNNDVLRDTLEFAHDVSGTLAGVTLITFVVSSLLKKMLSK